jgi:hypothetical protein
VVLLVLGVLLAGCGNGMRDQPRYEPYEPSTFFENGMASRPLLPNTVARGQLRTNTHLYAGQQEGRQAEEFPFPVTDAVLARGQQRYNIYCTPCHGYSGYGDGIIVQRGLTPPPSLHEERLLAAPVGHLFGVITNGIGAMYSYGERIPPEDRWAIIAYIRALQLSQNATLDAVPAEQQTVLEALPTNTPAPATATPIPAPTGMAPAAGVTPVGTPAAEPITGTEEVTGTGIHTGPAGQSTPVTMSVTVTVEVPITGPSTLSVTVELTDPMGLEEQARP